ncbi:hypothetical protein Mpet_0808 [Methanolacinia petrolearia DSM 11571]|uniref:Pyrrolo-quinoline quinone n=1 Tax=Methanolacinia petrolearia (strain DSM 11571 / OCM 486 / SEBR 4847) TaxID=679926 RepID=E1RIZ3_METP4|nr:hypothetical protein [Methanolacinia petrolearia]ADN35581.1 hypothetical protein Mpet_0808 [Methanolacinia petrolearia DSM 11571]
MNLEGTAKSLDQAFYYILLVVLVLSSFMYLFVFILNWEAWFFGMKLDGPDAGILLFVYFLVPGILAFLLFRYPRRVSVIALLSILYFSFRFIDSSATVRELSGGVNSFNTFNAVLMVILLFVLVVHFIAARFYEPEGESDEGNKDEKKPEPVAAEPEISTPENGKQDNYLVAKLFILGLVAFAVVLLFGPLVVSVFFSFLVSSVSTPAPIIVGDSVISKVDANGTTEWQTVVNGYSDYQQEVCSSNDGGYIMAGMFFLGEKNRNLRAMKFDNNGSVIWDINRSVSAYPEVDLQDIKRALQTGDEYTIIMLNGIVIRLDEDGNELWHRYYPHKKHIVDSIALPDGGYLLVGEVNEDGADGWKFDGWILCADSEGNTLWEKKEKDFTNCRRAVMSPEGYILLDCYAGCYDPDSACSDPEQSGDMIVALDLQGNYLWKTRFIENIDGKVYSIEPLDNGTIEVRLRGEGEREYILDKEGNVLIQKFLSSQADSYDHDFILYRKYEAEPVEGNGVRVNVTEADGSEKFFIIQYPENVSGIRQVFSVNPTPDGGYIVAGS